MLKNYLITGLRNIWRNKLFSLINVLGLAFGITCSLLILLWVQDERRIDAFHKNGSLLYAVYERQFNDEKVEAGYYTPGPLGDELKKKIPEIVYASTARQNNDISTFELADKILREQGNFAGEDFFKMFSYPLLIGNAGTVFSAPSSILISRKMANELFGSPEDAIGKSVRYENQRDYMITGIFENVPSNSSEKFDYLINWQSFLESNKWARQWDNNSPRTYVMLREGADPVVVENKIRDFLKSYNKYLGPHLKIELGLQRFTDMYLHSNFKNGYISGGRIEYVRIFSIVALMILLIASINFMNLATARSTKRAKEIGVRKVTGALRSSIIKQFMSEALLFVLIAVAISIIFVVLILPVFNSFTGKAIAFPTTDKSFWIELLALTAVTAFVSGSYPALLLSGFHPMKVLKGSLKFAPFSTLLRRVLVVFQFILSIALIIAAIVISQQVKYIEAKDIGFEKQNLVYIPLEGNLPTNYKVLKDEALKLPSIAGVTRITSVPTQIGGNTWGVDWIGKDPNSRPLFTTAEVGYEFARTVKLQLLQGRDFSQNYGADSANYLVNETALHEMRYEDPIGKPLSLWGTKGQIIGVVKDFHFNSLREPITPLIIKLGENDDWGYALVRTKPAKTKQALESLEGICKKLNPQYTFQFQFADEDYQSLYKNEMVIDKLANYFSFLAIFISCLGLLGLAIFTTEQRTKEIGIRKVVGASVSAIVGMLSKDILKLVTIACVIASPIAWFAMNKWLQNYAYRIHISWWVFIVAGLLATLIALLSVSFQSIRAAIANPVKSLRTE